MRRRLVAAAEAFADPEGRAGSGRDAIGVSPHGDSVIGVGTGQAGQPRPAAPRPPEPLPGLRHVVLLVLDSCRYDAWVAAKPKNLARLGEPERRWSYASWTGPSHYNLLTGLLPHSSPQRVFASEYYKHDFLRWSERVGTELSFARMLPGLWLPTLLRWGLGYRTSAFVSLPVLNPATGVNRDFDEFVLMDSHHDFAGMIERMRFYVDRPCFFLLNLGETHYPYSFPGDLGEEMPQIHGVHGVVKRLDGMREQGGGGIGRAEEPRWFDAKMLKSLKNRQVQALRYVDATMERLWDLLPKDSHVVVTSDHGELFGEGGWFGHGPIQHDKVYEVPFVEGRIR
jgi:hypothetical protein